MPLPVWIATTDGLTSSTTLMNWSSRLAGVLVADAELGLETNVGELEHALASPSVASVAITTIALGDRSIFHEYGRIGAARG